MNARLQRVWFWVRWLGAAAIGWHFGWGWGLVAAWVYPLSLLPSFAGLRWINRGAHAPRWGDLLQAWAREVVATEMSFGWRQPWRTHAEPDHLPAPAQGATHGVLLVHGFSCNRAFWNVWMARLRQQRGVAFVAPSLEPAFGRIDAYAEPLEQAVQQLVAATGRMPVIVCHSMGGVAVRAWWRRYGGDGREAPQVITLGTPHGGTLLAALSPAYNARQMRWQCDWIRALPPLPRLTAVWTPCDQMVMPALTAAPAGSSAHRIDAVGHVGLVSDPRVWALFQTALAGSSLSTPRRI